MLTRTDPVTGHQVPDYETPYRDYSHPVSCRLRNEHDVFRAAFILGETITQQGNVYYDIEDWAGEVHRVEHGDRELDMTSLEFHLVQVA